MKYKLILTLNDILFRHKKQLISFKKDLQYQPLCKENNDKILTETLEHSKILRKRTDMKRIKQNFKDMVLQCKNRSPSIFKLTQTKKPTKFSILCL